MTSTASCRRLRALVAQVAPAPSADRSFAGSELDPVSGAQAGMTITDIKPYPTWQGHRNIMLVKVECEGGLYGWGEAGLSGRELAVSGAVDHYKQFLIGQDGMRIGALWQEMYRSQYFEGGRALTAAISAIDIALHDCLGKKLGVPVYQLLGGAHRHHVPCMVSCAANVETVKARVAEGWQNIRLSRGNGAEDETSSAGEVYSQPTTVIHKNQQGPPVRQGSDPDLFEPRIAIANSIRDFTAVRAAVGPGPTLGTDFHTRLNVAECASLLQKMPPGTLDWIEEPIRDESPEAYEELRKLTPVPFAIGEEFSSKWQFLPFIEKGLANYCRVDVPNVGGFTEAMKVAGWCEAHYIDLMPHNPLGPVSTAACIHLGSAVPNFAYLEDNFSVDTMHSQWDSKVFPKLLMRETTIERHAALGYPVPTDPGLGIEINEEALIAQPPFKFWNPPFLRRKDGSLNNW